MDPHIPAHARPKIGSERKFGLTAALLLAVIAIWPLWSGHKIHLWAAAAALIFLCASLLAPSLLKPVNRLWFELGLLLGRIMSPVILGLFFCVVITPLAIVMRLFRNDLLHLERQTRSRSYLIDRAPPGPGIGTFNNQF